MQKHNPEKLKREERSWQDEIGNRLIDDSFSFEGSIEVYRRQFEKIIRRIEKSRDFRLLEIGCGRGQLAEAVWDLYKGRNVSIVALDISTKLTELRKKYGNGIEWITADGENLPFADNIFDIVICNGSLHHMPDFKKSLDEIFRVANSGGQIILYEPVSTFFSRGIHKLLDPFVFKKVRYESPVDVVCKDDFRLKPLLNYIGERSDDYEFSWHDFAAYPLTGCYAGSKFARSRRFMRAILAVEDIIERLPIFRNIFNPICWRILIDVRSCKDNSKNEPWPGYFDLRSKETELFLHFFRGLKDALVLDVGCGTGFVSAILSKKAKRVIAMDIPYSDSATHSPGIWGARDLAKKAGCGNVDLVGASADRIPFKDKHFDIVFSQYTLEHVAVEQRKHFLKEANRVLKDGGKLALMLPTFTERFFGYIYYYFDLGWRALRKLLSKKKKSSDKSSGAAAPFRAKRNYLLPPIHGNYRSRTEELSSQFPGSWKRLIEQNGFSVEKTFTVRFMPISNRAAAFWYKKTSCVTRLVGDKIPFKFLGKCFCIIAKKAGS